MKYHIVIDSFIGGWAYSKQYVRTLLSKYEGKHVDVLISSPGGSVDHGFDIMRQFQDHGDVTVYLSGLVASAATIIAMGAKRVIMTKSSAFLAHRCSNYIDIWGSYNADQIQKLIADLEKNKKDNERIDLIIANIYADKCRKKVTDILPVLKKGEWMTPQEALDFGFVDEIVDPSADMQKLNLSTDNIDRLNALGISTDGLTPERFGLSDVAEPASATEPEGKVITDGTLTKFPNMDKYNFPTVEALLKLDAIQVDKDGYVSVTAEDFEKINTRLKELEDDLNAKNDAVAAKDTEITDLKEQVKNLTEAPGDKTEDIKDDAEEVEACSATNLYNSIKDAL